MADRRPARSAKAPPPPASGRPAAERLRVEVRGAVQGVGFRPFVYRLAHRLGVAGWALNNASGVLLEVEGERQVLERFLATLREQPPPHAVVHSLAPSWLAAVGYARFEIVDSDGVGARSAVVLPDLVTCDECLAEIFDPANRRHRYPFTNCTNCGPRFTIVHGLPYDRPNTTMRRFPMCPTCEDEYGEPLDRRFHAQPNACRLCGPQLVVNGCSGEATAAGDDALRAAAATLLEGGVVAVKGLGGFQLMVNATDEDAVRRLRHRKGREAKPLALMAVDLDAVRRIALLSPAAAALLSSPAGPIVLLERRPVSTIAPSVAPGQPQLGVMLPTTPLHHLLLREVDRPLVATSGNRSEEPICIDEEEALERLGGIADLFLVHDRPIARHADDSVVRLVCGAPQLLRRARGYAPLPVRFGRSMPSILAVGGHLKNTVALSLGDLVFVSQHVGDLEVPQAREVFERVIRDFLELYGAAPVAVAHDLHPDYPSTRWAERAVAGEGASWGSSLRGLPLLGVQHHHAHLAACLAEHRLREEEALGVIWDGTGWGPDGTVWGGEALVGSAAGYARLATLRRFRLPGGELAVREPRRAALGLLLELYGEAALELDLPVLREFSEAQLRLLWRAYQRGVNAPWTTSAGRLFDAVAALLDLRQRSLFEGQAAMELEAAAQPGDPGAYPLPLRAPLLGAAEVECLDWGPLVEAVLEERSRGVESGVVAARFHQALVEAIALLAQRAGRPRVALSGGCFQNRRLTEGAVDRLQRDGFDVLLQRQVPANDGGLSLGQIAVAAARWESAARGGPRVS